jgi:hypothetical protein
MFARRKVAVVSAAVLAAVLTSDIAAASPAVCNLRLSIELTPDVPNPLESGFLSSLLNNQVSYRLTLLGRQPGSVIVTELVGPGPGYRCRNVVEAMRKDGRVLSIHLDQDSAVAGLSGGVPRRSLDLRPPDLRSLDVADRQQVDTSSDYDDVEALTIAAAQLVLEEKPDAQPPRGGIASLYWAARHLTQASRVLLPMQLDGYELSPENPERARGDARPEALAEQRDIGENPAPPAGGDLQGFAGDLSVASSAEALVREYPGVQEPGEVASLVAYIASPLASATTGAALRVDGGVIRSAF